MPAIDDPLAAALQAACQALAPGKAGDVRSSANDLAGDWEERAAIIEFDGGMSRAEAERAATVELQDSGGRI